MKSGLYENDVKVTVSASCSPAENNICVKTGVLPSGTVLRYEYQPGKAIWISQLYQAFFCKWSTVTVDNFILGKNMKISGPEGITPYKIEFSYNDKAYFLQKEELKNKATLYFSAEAGKWAQIYNSQQMNLTFHQFLWRKSMYWKYRWHVHGSQEYRL